MTVDTKGEDTHHSCIILGLTNQRNISKGKCLKQIAKKKISNYKTLFSVGSIAGNFHESEILWSFSAEPVIILNSSE